MKQLPHSETPPTKEMGIFDHLAELRSRLLKAVLVVLGLWLCSLPFAQELYQFFSTPLLKLLPEDAQMIATSVTSGFMAPFKLSAYIALVATAPYVLYQCWAFIAPALYQHEKKKALPLLISSISLFYIGIAFAYFLVLPNVLRFFINMTPDTVTTMTDIQFYLDFCLHLFLMFGLAFQIPVFIMALVLIKVLSPQQLAEKRRYIIVGCFFVSMFITPPDALSMLMLAIPMVLLFELGLLMSRIIIRDATS